MEHREGGKFRWSLSVTMIVGISHNVEEHSVYFYSVICLFVCNTIDMIHSSTEVKVVPFSNYKVQGHLDFSMTKTFNWDGCYGIYAAGRDLETLKWRPMGF